MAKKTLIVVLGNQLFPLSHYAPWVKEGAAFFMAEDHGLCTHFQYHHHKLILFLAAMRHYADALQSQGWSLTYHRLTEDHQDLSYIDKLAQTVEEQNITHIRMVEIEDRFMEERIQAFCKKNDVALTLEPSPMFLCSRALFASYLKEHNKPFMKTFYEKMRRHTGVLMTQADQPEKGQYSFDADNRKKLPKDISFPKRLTFEPSEHVRAVETLCKTLFANHPGKGQPFEWAVTRHDALKVLTQFVEKKLLQFGDYQDAITTRDDDVFHSMLSPYINMGLLTPKEVLDAVLKAYKKDQAPINAVEGFVRQVLGWREFVRGIYQHFDDKQQGANFFKARRSLTDAWYEGSTGIPPLDDVIQKTQRKAYAHHIERLMIVGNMMVLCEIEPKQAFAWFMEMFVDSSDWVMGPNVFGMALFSDGGLFATKPYICGSNYWLKMTRSYKKDAWCDTVDGLYWRMIDRHKDFYASNPRLSMMVRTLDRLSKERKAHIFKQADAFLAQHTA
jgi:deoxyribodipyrimidine photolyase-related protein